MKKIIVFGIGGLIVLGAVLLAVSCEQGAGPPDAVTSASPLWPEQEGETEEEEPVVTVGIEVVSAPSLTLYARGQNFAGFDGLAVHWLKSDGSRSQNPLAAAEYTLDPETIDTSYGHAVPVTVRSKAQPAYTGEFLVNVMNSTSVLQDITITQAPKTTYYIGETFSKTGMTVTGTYNDGDKTIASGAVSVEGYDRFKRGAQTVTLRVNNLSKTVNVTVNVPQDAAVTLNHYKYGSVDRQRLYMQPVYIKGKDFDFAHSNLKAAVQTSGGVAAALTVENGGIKAADITDFDKNTAGPQTVTLVLDEASAEFEVYVIDAAPAVWFDYGYMRHAGDTTGAGPGAGKYFAAPSETLVLAPVRYLIGYNDDHSAASGTTYSWSVSGGAYDTTAATTGETFAFKPSAAGDYTVSVTVGGRNYVTGDPITKTASTTVHCYTGTVPAHKPFTTEKVGLRNFAPSQFTEGGTGYGWSLGAAGGYWVYRVDPQPYYRISGNPMATWSEAGIVWVQEDKNGNGIPDEMWYELKGSDEYYPSAKEYDKQITRRYAITYVKGTGAPTVNGYDQVMRDIYWADSRGRSGKMGGGWSSPWGVTGDWVTFTGTLLRDTGNIVTGDYSAFNEMGGYVDCWAYGERWSTKDTYARFHVEDAMRADGTPAHLQNIRFIKVQTAILFYGGIFGDVSTEISGADFLGITTNFPLP
jgi:hypothetical protein